MTRILRTFRRPVHRLAGRLRTARPGSVLILVVALLVLMALIGTAWLTTARTDRYSAQQNSYNTQVDLLLQSVIALAESSVTGDLYAGGKYRPLEGNTVADYEHWDAIGDRNAFLASALPEVDMNPVAAGNQIGWPAVSRNPTAG